MPANETFQRQPHATCTARPAAAYREIIPWCMETLSSRCSWDYFARWFGSSGEADSVM